MIAGDHKDEGNGPDWTHEPLLPFRFEARFAQATSAATAEAVNVASAAFSEITGLEATMEPKVLKEGGRNFGVVQLVGPTTFSTVVFKRGISKSGDLWKVFETVAGGSYNSRLDVTITMWAPNGKALYAWKLFKALPTKFKTADFNATSSSIGIEELHLAHEGIIRKDAT